MEKVIVRLIKTSEIKSHYDFVLSFVSEARKQKAKQFASENDQLLSLGAGYLLKKYLPSSDIKRLPHGKPYLENGPCFNYSHSGEYVAFASHSSRPVGVDIERIDESKLKAIKYVVKEEGTTEEFFQMWSNKESLIKCKSTGIQDIKKAPALPLSGVREFDDKKYYTKSIIYNGYSLSITLEGDKPFEIEIVSEIL